MKKWLLGIVLVLVLLVVSAVFVLPAMVSVDDIKQRLTEEVAKATGRNLVVEGDVKLAFWPAASVQLEKVRLSNASWATHKDMLTVEKLSLQLAWMPLFNGNIRINEFSLTQPVILLERSAKGEPNWQFAEAVPANQIAQAEPAQTNDAQAGAGIDYLKQLELGEVKIEKGVVQFLDHATKKEIALRELDAQLLWQNMDSPLQLTLAGVWNDKPLNAKVNTTALKAFLQGNGETEVTVDANGAGVELDYTGELKRAEKVISTEGNLGIASGNIRDALQQFGIQVALPREVLKQASLHGRVKGNASKVTVDQARLVLDAISATGAVEADMSGTTPAITLSLVSELLDVTPYMPAQPKPTSSLFVSDAYAVDVVSTEWDDTPVDFSWIRGVKLDADIKAVTFKARDLVLEQLTLKTLIQGGKLALHVPSVMLYGGQGEVKLDVTPQENGASIVTSGKLQNIAVEKLLEAYNFHNLTGKGETEWALTTSGHSVRGWVQQLNGSGALNLKDGVVKGINLLEVARNIKSALSSNSNASTPFTLLAASYTVKNGVIANQDLNLESPYMNVTGQGIVSLPPKTVDYRLKPTLLASKTATPEGTAPAAGSKGLSLTVLVQGPLASPSFRPDLSSAIEKAMKDPKAAKKDLQNLRKDLKGGLKGLLGGN